MRSRGTKQNRPNSLLGVGILGLIALLNSTSPTLALVELEPLSPSLEGSIRSTEGVTPTTIEFVNSAAEPRQIVWLDYAGQRVLYYVLQPGQSYVQGTWLTHPWLITNASGHGLAIYLPVAEPGRVTIPNRYEFPPTTQPPAPRGSLADIRIIPYLEAFSDCFLSRCRFWHYEPIVKNFSSDWFTGVNVTAKWTGQTVSSSVFPDFTLSPVNTCLLDPPAQGVAPCQAFAPVFTFELPLPAPAAPPADHYTTIEFTITWTGGTRGPGSKKVTVLDFAP